MSERRNPPLAGDPTMMSRVIELSRESMRALNGGPFAAMVVRGDEIISCGTNSVTLWNDPTAHAEVVAIRRACSLLRAFQLSDCEIYSSCEPCPMCVGAIYWARPRMVYFGGDRSDAASAGFDDAVIYDELALPPGERRIPMLQMMREQAAQVLAEWKAKPDKLRY